jgi:hypothetical protein
MIQSSAAPASAPITAATKAKPCVLTVTGGSAAVGSVVVPRNTGFASLDDRPFVVSAVAAGAVTLGDSDTTNEIATLGASATLEEPTLIELCRSTLTLNNPAGATIDVTTLCDDAHKIVSGLPAIATWQANGFYDSFDTAMLAARDYYRSGLIVSFKATFRDGSGITWAGNVNVFDITAGINAAVTSNMGGNVSGLMSFFPGTGGVFAAEARPQPQAPAERVAA